MATFYTVRTMSTGVTRYWTGTCWTDLAADAKHYAKVPAHQAASACSIYGMGICHVYRHAKRSPDGMPYGRYINGDYTLAL